MRATKKLPPREICGRAGQRHTNWQDDVADLRAWLKTPSSAANQVGSLHDKANAQYVRDLFRQWGWDARIEVFEVLYPTLRAHTLEMTAPSRFVASLTEPPVEGDTTSSRDDALAPYNEYSADGDVTGELVYLNYGMPEGLPGPRTARRRRAGQDPAAFPGATGSGISCTHRGC